MRNYMDDYMGIICYYNTNYHKLSINYSLMRNYMDD